MADKPMTIIDHLAELRRRLLISAASLLAGIVLSLVFYKNIIDLLTRAADHPKLYFFTLTGAIGPIMKIAFLGGFIVALPVTVYQIVAFISPGLTPKERRYLFLLLPAVGFSFLAGVFFAYFVMIPPMVRFLLSFGSDIATPQVSLESYVNTVTSLLFWVGVVFELPVLMYFLTFLRVARPSFFSRFRKPWIVLAFVLAAIITPTPDPVNQTLVALPMIVLYEVGILLSKLAARKPRKRAALQPGPSEAAG